MATNVRTNYVDFGKHDRKMYVCGKNVLNYVSQVWSFQPISLRLTGPDFRSRHGCECDSTWDLTARLRSRTPLMWGEQARKRVGVALQRM